MQDTEGVELPSRYPAIVAEVSRRAHRVRGWLLGFAVVLGACDASDAERYCGVVVCEPKYPGSRSRIGQGIPSGALCEWASGEAVVTERCYDRFDRTWERMSSEVRDAMRTCFDCLETTALEPGTCSPDAYQHARHACMIACQGYSFPELFDDNFWFDFPEPFICSPG